MTEYSCGFAFQGENVLLICKDKPDWMEGLLNGVGGHIEPGESPVMCMRREFTEETGLELYDWRHFATCVYKDSRVWWFAGWHGDIAGARRLTSEEPYVLPLAELDQHLVMPNLAWLIPMALDKMGSEWPYEIHANATMRAREAYGQERLSL